MNTQRSKAKYFITIFLLLIFIIPSLEAQKIEWVIDTVATKYIKGNGEIALLGRNESYVYNYEAEQVEQCNHLRRICNDFYCYESKYDIPNHTACHEKFNTYRKKYPHDFKYFESKYQVFRDKDSTYLYRVEDQSCMSIGPRARTNIKNDKFLTLSYNDSYAIYLFDKDKLLEVPQPCAHIDGINEHYILCTNPNYKENSNEAFVYDFDMNLIFSSDNSFFDRAGESKDFLYINQKNQPPVAFHKKVELELDPSISKIFLEHHSDGVATIKNHFDKYGLMKTNGEIIAPAKFESLDVEYSGVRPTIPAYCLSKKGFSQIYHTNGKLILEGNYDYITILDSNRYAVKVGSRKGVIDTLGNEIIPVKNYGAATFSSMNNYGIKLITLKNGYGLPGDNYSIFDYYGKKIADWTVKTENPRVISSEANFRLTLEFLKSLDADQINSITKCDAWDTSNQDDNKRYVSLINHIGKELTPRFLSLQGFNVPFLYLVKTFSGKYGIIRVRN